MTRILLIEDNANLAFGLKNNLEIEGYHVEIARDGDRGLERAREAALDLVVLDLMIPGLDGFRVLRALRGDGVRVPILVLTARGEETDKVRALRLGADDYVTKPFGILELLARIEAILRRAGDDAGLAAPPAADRFSDVEVDVRTRTVLRRGAPVDLTPKEFDLLVALLRRRGAVAKRGDLLREVWRVPASLETRTLDTHIAELRRKLERDPGNPRHILTVRKSGYRLAR
jgi:DNA-binding response OmpR family regulator